MTHTPTVGAGVGGAARGRRYRVLTGVTVLTLAVTAAVTAAAVWRWPRVYPGDLAALEAIAPPVPAGRFYSQDSGNTRCGWWGDCPHAHLVRYYTIDCADIDVVTETFARELTSRGFPAPVRLTGEYITGPGAEWNAGSVTANVTTHTIWARYTIDPDGHGFGPRGEPLAGCTLAYVLSISNHG